MLRSIGENLGLKAIALILSIGIWFYAAAERNPVASKKVTAEVQLVGKPPQELIIKPRSEPLSVEISGPRSELDSIMDGEIKAIVPASEISAESHDLKISDYRIPSSAPNVSIKNAPQFARADVIPKQRRRVAIEAVYNRDNPLGRVYSTVKLDPNSAWAVGSKTDIQRVAKLEVFIETRGANVRDDLPIYAVDRNDVQIDDVQIEPAKTHVDLSLVEAPTTRSLIVSCPLSGKPAAGFRVSEVSVKPDQITVAGKPDLLLQLTNIPTAEVNIEGIVSDITREVPLRLPDGVTVKDGAKRVTVTVKVRDTTRTTP